MSYFRLRTDVIIYPYPGSWVDRSEIAEVGTVFTKERIGGQTVLKVAVGEYQGWVSYLLPHDRIKVSPIEVLALL